MDAARNATWRPVWRASAVTVGTPAARPRLLSPCRTTTSPALQCDAGTRAGLIDADSFAKRPAAQTGGLRLDARLIPGVACALDGRALVGLAPGLGHWHVFQAASPRTGGEV